jgi:hypothetical protein
MNKKRYALATNDNLRGGAGVVSLDGGYRLAKA